MFKNLFAALNKSTDSNVVCKDIVGSQITINGGTYRGNSISIKNGSIIIDGNKIEMNDKQISIQVSGDLNSLDVDSCDKINIDGNVDRIKSGSGDVYCQNVASGVETGSGNVNVSSNITGNVKTGSGDVDCKNITGSIETGSGDVNSGNVGGNVNTRSGDIQYKK